MPKTAGISSQTLPGGSIRCLTAGQDVFQAQKQPRLGFIFRPMDGLGQWQRQLRASCSRWLSLNLKVLHTVEAPPGEPGRASIYGS